DIVGAQAPQASFDGAHDVVPVERRLAGPHRREKPAGTRSGDLGGNEQGVARLAGHPLADDLFAAAGVLDVRRHGLDLGDVQKADAGVVRALQYRKAGAFIRLVAEGHSPQANLQNDQAGAAKLPTFHTHSSILRVGSYRRRLLKQDNGRHPAGHSTGAIDFDFLLYYRPEPTLLP